MISPEVVQQNYHSVVQRISAAAQRSGREAAEVQLVVVTKTHPPELIRAVVAAGARWLGENYVEAALPKIQQLADLPVAWHMIGHLQSRKAEQAAVLFQYIHSLDSLKLASRLDRFAAAQNRRLVTLLECNTSGEESKFGWPVWDESTWLDFVEQIRPLENFPHLGVQGLMTMAPYADDPEAARPFFRRLRRLRDFLAQRLPGLDWSVLSMGMSGDFEVAIEEGATWVRIGTSIFGSRGDQ